MIELIKLNFFLVFIKPVILFFFKPKCSFESFFRTLIQIMVQNINKNIVDRRSNLEVVFKEIILNSKLFLLSPHLLNLINCYKHLPTINFKYALYPFKLIVEDYLRTNNSTTLLNRYRKIRKIENTF